MTHAVADAELKTTIAVYEDEKGNAVHRFCTAEEGEAIARRAKARDSGASLISSEGWQADVLYSVSPTARERVDAAKTKLRQDIMVRNALNRNQIPNDRELRAKIYKAMAEVREESFGMLLANIK